MSQQLEFDLKIDLWDSITDKLSKPSGYKGLSALHKYWGKKPMEYLSFLIEHFTRRGDIVLDPFLGSGLLALETINMQRRFIGIDINPISIELARFFTNLPSYEELKEGFLAVEKEVKDKINSTYLTKNNNIATHYLYDGEIIKSVWIKNEHKQKSKLIPTEFDFQLAHQFHNYKPVNIGTGEFFQNSRINTKADMTINDLFTGRALYCIDLLIQSINKTNDKIKSALLLMLTSASGQMSKMVFAITNRGKNNGTPSKIDIEVGSWAIGYWKPKLHFEINVWNCFDNKVQKLLKTLKYQDTNNYTQVDDLNTFWDSKSDLCLIENDCKKILNNIPDDTIELIITDPPHGDRIPYLELSSLWNALLHKKPDYVSEIVVSNAKEREKNIASYNLDMKSVLCNMIRILKPQGILALIFNAVDKKYWEFLTDIDLKSKGTTYLGCFPLNYSANSLVQDNRQGALKHDYVLIFRKVQNHDNTDAMSVFNKIQGWSINFPLPLGEEK